MKFLTHSTVLCASMILVLSDLPKAEEEPDSKGRMASMYKPPPPPPPSPPVGYQQQPGLNPPVPNPMGGPSLFAPSYPEKKPYFEPVTKVLDTSVDCVKTHMIVSLKMSRPFYGFIYPYNNFDKCLIFVGKGQTDIKMELSHDPCGLPLPPKYPGSPPLDPVIQHHLMVQWEPDLVQEYDASIVVRCDRPEDYNRTVKFDLASAMVDSPSLFRQNTHPGPMLYMEVQRGEGPKAEQLQGPVYLGETLTLVFTLADDVFWFDTSVLHCWASDGDTERRPISWSQPNAPRPVSPQIPVITNACSLKPKLFGHFQKNRQEYPNQLTTTQWAFFKAFRFPTSSRVVVQCDVQVCFKKCYPLPPCEDGYRPHSEYQRRRREAPVDNTTYSEVDPERVTVLRTLEVLLPEETEIRSIRYPSGNSRGGLSRDESCVSNSTYYGTILGMGIVILIMVLLVIAYLQKQGHRYPFQSPSK